MSKKFFVVSPLPQHIIENLCTDSQQKIEQISFSLIKNSRIMAVMKTLRSIRDMHVVFGDVESKKLIDIFFLLFIFTKSKKMRVTYHDLSEHTFKKREAISVIAKSILASALGVYLLIRSIFILNTTKKKSIKTERKHVLYLKTNFWFNVLAGGSVAHIEGVIGGFKKNGFKIDFSGIEPPHSSKSLNNFFKIPIPKFLSYIYDLNLHLFDYEAYKFLKKELKYKKYCFIYHRMALNSFSAILLSKKLKIPLILEYNGPEVWIQRNWGKPLLFERVAQYIENANLHYADYIVTVSHALKEQLLHRGVQERKIICYPNGVDLEKFNPDLFSRDVILEKRKHLGFSNDDIILTFIGTFGKWHGTDILAHTLKELCENHLLWLRDQKVKFLLVGDGPCMADMKSSLSLIPECSNFITFTGLVPQEEAPSYLALSDILLSPHCPLKGEGKFFGSPTKIFEYMAMKKIIIASNLEQIEEVLSPSINIREIENINESHLAILFKPGCSEEFIMAIKYAVDNRLKISFLGSNSQKKALRKYTWEKHVKIITEFLSLRN